MASTGAAQRDGALTLEAMAGTKVDALSDSANGGFDRTLIASRLVEAYLRQFFDFGVFHADPHPGNLLINAPGRITLIDFGQVGLINDELADQLLVLLLSFVYQESALAVDVLGEMGALGSETDNAQLQRAIRVLDNKYYGQPLNRVDPTELFQESNELFHGQDACSADVDAAEESDVGVQGGCPRVGSRM